MADPKQARKGFLLRLPPQLLEELRGWAAQDLRSLNGQIEYLLREALRQRGRDGTADAPSVASGGPRPRRGQDPSA